MFEESGMYCSPAFEHRVETLVGKRLIVPYLDRALKLDDAMFAWRSRHLILVLTLKYHKQYRYLITLNHLRRDRDRFFANMRNNGLLRPINAYAWRIEEGGDGGGPHMHILIYYDRDHHGDVSIARRIGEYWVTVVTRGLGDYSNSNADKHKYENAWGIATGAVDRHDIAKRTVVRKVLAYFAKDEQHVTSWTVPHSRMFGTSQFPA